MLLMLGLFALGGLLGIAAGVGGAVFWFTRGSPTTAPLPGSPVAAQTGGTKDPEPAPAPPPVEKPAEEKPAGEKPAGEKPAGEKPAGEKPANPNPPAKEPPAKEPPAAKPPAASLRERLLGKWEREEQGQQVGFEFAADGTLLLAGAGPEPIKGKYRLTGEDTVEVEFQVPSGPMVKQTLKVAVGPEGLTTTDQDNRVERFTRARPGERPPAGEAAVKPREPGPAAPPAPPAPPGAPAAGLAALTPFTSQELGFRVGMPAEPKHIRRPAKVGTAHTFVAEAKDGPPVSYQVVCSDLPPGAPPKAVLDEVVSAFNPKWLKDRKAVTLQGHPGMEFVLELERAGLTLSMVNRAYVARDRLYHLVLTSPKGAVGPEAASAFFESFRLLDEPRVAGGKPPETKPPETKPPETKPPETKPPETKPPVQPVRALAGKPLPRPVTAAEALKGETRAVDDLQVTEVKLPPETTLGCLAWADDKGSAFCSLDGSGVLRRTSFPALEQTWKLELPEKGSWLSVSAAGLLVTVPGAGEVWVIDPDTGAMKQRYAIPRVQRAVSAVGQDVAVATDGEQLHVLDLTMGQSRPFDVKGLKQVGCDGPVMTPDGKYLFTTGSLETMHRFAIERGQLRFEQTSPRIAQGVVNIGVQVSPDSKRVCLPSFAGNYGAGKYGAVFVYPVKDITRAEFTLEPGPGCQAVGFDPAASRIYGTALRLFDDQGKLLKEYPLHQPPLPSMKQILVHPAGGRLLLFTGERLALVEAPKP